MAIASILHYDFISHNKYEFKQGEEGNIEFLKSKKIFSKITTSNLLEIKNYLVSKNIKCRHKDSDGRIE